MAGQAHYFREFSGVEDSPAIKRFSKETHRLFVLLDKPLEDKACITGDDSIVDGLLTRGLSSPLAGTGGS